MIASYLNAPLRFLEYDGSGLVPIRVGRWNTTYLYSILQSFPIAFDLERVVVSDVVGQGIRFVHVTINYLGQGAESQIEGALGSIGDPTRRRSVVIHGTIISSFPAGPVRPAGS